MNNSRRNFLKKAGYAAPAVITMSAMPAMASIGSNETDKGNETEVQAAQPARWQTRARRNRLRRMERQGLETDRFRFDDWERVDTATWTIKS